MRRLCASNRIYLSYACKAIIFLGNWKWKKELSQDVRGIIVQKHEDGLSYRKISKDVDVPAQNIASVIQKWKAMKTIAAL